MGLDFSIYKIKKLNNVPFQVVYAGLFGLSVSEIRERNNELKESRLNYLKTIYGQEPSLLSKKIEEVVLKFNSLEKEKTDIRSKYDALSGKEKAEILSLEEIEYKYYGKDWALFNLLTNPILGQTFEDEESMPVNELKKELLEDIVLYAEIKDENNKGITSLKKFLENADFKNFYYYLDVSY